MLFYFLAMPSLVCSLALNVAPSLPCSFPSCLPHAPPFPSITETRPGYGKPNAQAIFESFFGTANPFADFGYNDALPFGSRLKKPGPKKAAPICHDLALTLEELFNGCTKKLTITRKVRGEGGDGRAEGVKNGCCGRDEVW